MFTKFLFVAAILAVVFTQPIEEDTGAYHHVEKYPDAHPKYDFKYAVADEHTGDHKSQHEERDGDVVKGEYTVLQPDGQKRIVHYTSDHENGFVVQISYSGDAIHH